MAIITNPALISSATLPQDLRDTERFGATEELRNRAKAEIEKRQALAGTRNNTLPGHGHIRREGD